MLRRWAKRFRCWARGHSNRVIFSYRYRPGAVVDSTVVSRCARCSAILPSTTLGGIVTMGKYRVEKASKRERL